MLKLVKLKTAAKANSKTYTSPRQSVLPSHLLQSTCRKYCQSKPESYDELVGQLGSSITCFHEMFSCLRTSLTRWSRLTQGETEVCQDANKENPVEAQ